MTSWIMPWGNLASLRQVNEPLAAAFFNRSSSFVVGNTPPAGGWTTTPVANFTSYGDFVSAPSSLHWVMYNNELWSGTPVLEQRHPVAYMNAFALLAHQRGLQCVAAPARNLVAVPGGDLSQLPGETVDAAYIRGGLPAAAADADVFECQSQADQLDVAAFTDLVLKAKAQQRTGQALWVGLTTLIPDPVASMIACYSAVVTSVQGFWINTSAATVSKVVSFLDSVTP